MNTIDKLYLTIALMLAIPFTEARAQGMMDVHSHNIPPYYVDMLELHDAALEETFPLPAWDIAAHLRFMDSAGIGCTVLSMPAPQPYFGDSQESAAIIRRYNEDCARLKAEHPGRFKFCASLPLPDVEAALREAVYALDTLKADGIKLATNSRGQYVGDAALDTLMGLLNERGTVIILHPHRPTPFAAEVVETTPLAAYEYPAETTRAVVNMIARNVLVRYPRLKVVVPHCGSFLPLALPRLKQVHPAMLRAGLMQSIDWEGNLSRLYYDLAGFSTPEVVKSLLTITTPDHLLYGSDYPYMPDEMLEGNAGRLHHFLASDPVLAPHAGDIMGGNARRLFGE